MLTLIAEGGLTGTIPANAGGGIFVSSIPPDSSLTSKVWFKIDAAGRPLGTYMFYNGNWRKVYTGVTYQEIRMIFGDPTPFFDGTGLGLVGKDLDGWALCNGKNGTPDMMSRFAFPVAGSWGFGGFDGWNIQDPVSGNAQAAGGQGIYGHPITIRDLPSLQVQAFGNARGVTDGSSNLYEVAAAGATNIGSVPVTDGSGAQAGHPSQTPLPLPNYQGFGFIMFVGYA
jgi:hypothetical protein